MGYLRTSTYHVEMITRTPCQHQRLSRPRLALALKRFSKAEWTSHQVDDFQFYLLILIMLACVYLDRPVCARERSGLQIPCSMSSCITSPTPPRPHRRNGSRSSLHLDDPPVISSQRLTASPSLFGALGTCENQQFLQGQRNLQALCRTIRTFSDWEFRFCWMETFNKLSSKRRS